MSGTCGSEGCTNQAGVEIVLHVYGLLRDTFPVCMAHLSPLLRQMADVNDRAEALARREVFEG